MDPGILSRTVRVWTGITPPGREAPKGRAISAASIGVLLEGLRRELRRESDPEALHAHPPEGTVTKVCPGPVAGHRWGAVPEVEDPVVEVMEGLPEGVPAEVDLVEVPEAEADGVEASGIS